MYEYRTLSEYSCVSHLVKLSRYADSHPDMGCQVFFPYNMLQSYSCLIYTIVWSSLASSLLMPLHAEHLPDCSHTYCSVYSTNMSGVPVLLLGLYTFCKLTSCKFIE